MLGHSVISENRKKNKRLAAADLFIKVTTKGFTQHEDWDHWAEWESSSSLLSNNMKTYIFHQMSYTWSLGYHLVLVCVAEHSPSYSMKLCHWAGSSWLLTLHCFTPACKWRRAQVTQRDMFLLLAPWIYCAFSMELLLDKVKKKSW